jgi:hypothetical protein
MLGGNITPAADIAQDLGSSARRFNNLYAMTVNTAAINTSGQGVFNYSPASADYSAASLLINPTAAPADSVLLGLGIAGTPKFTVDEDGDIVAAGGLNLGGSLELGANTLATSNSTLVSNLNADLLDGQHGSYYAPLANIAGTAGYLSKFTDAGAIGDSVLYESGGNVGIGTTTPTSLFHVNSANTTNGLTLGKFFSALDSDGEYNLIGVGKEEAAGHMAYFGYRYDTTAGDEGAFITNYGDTISSLYVRKGGNVGIGTTTPGQKLEVASGYILLSNNYYYRVKNSAGTELNVLGVDSANDVKVGSGSANDLYFAAGGGVGYGMVLKATSGNIGIGTTAPGNKLTVNGKVGISRISPAAADLAWLDYTAQANGFSIGNDSGVDPITFFTNGSERMRILSSGNVGIGTTAPASLLEIKSTSATSGITLSRDAYVTSTLNLSNIGTSGDQALVTNSNAYDWRIGGNSGKLVMTNSGNVGIGTTGPSAGLTIANGRAQFTSNVVPTGGAGVEIGYDGTNGVLLAYDRGVSAYKGLNFNGGAMFLTSAGNIGIGTVLPGSKLSVSGGGSIGSSYATTAVSDGSFIVSGNVGIGTTSPGYPLDVNGVINTNSSYRILGTNILSGSGNTLNVGPSTTWTTINYGNASTAIHAFSAGNVGIGTTNPATALHLRKDNAGALGPTLTLENGAGVTGAGANIDTILSNASTIVSRIGTIRTSVPSGAASDLFFSTYDGTALTERMRILSTGNVGIGTTGPGTKLDVNGIVQATGYYVGGVYLGRLSGSVIGIGSAGAYGLSLYAGAADRLYVQSSTGNIGIGTTGPNRRLEVVDGSVIQLRLTTSGSNYWDIGRNTSTGDFNLTDSGGAGTAFVVKTTSGNVGIGTTDPQKLLHISLNYETRF